MNDALSLSQEGHRQSLALPADFFLVVSLLRSSGPWSPPLPAGAGESVMMCGHTPGDNGCWSLGHHVTHYQLITIILL